MDEIKIFNAPIEHAKRISGDTKTAQKRNDFMRDRDRIMYSKAFRRLSGKTQVFVTGTDDHNRTRLTHTLEVSQIARTIAKQLGLDEDLCEAISLGHDIGHTPYGHAGERTLHNIMSICNQDKEKKALIKNSPFNIDLSNNRNKECVTQENMSMNCGFKHNLQSVQLLTKIEQSYYPNGLNLTNFTLYGIAIHSSLAYKNDKNENKLGFYDHVLNNYCKQEMGKNNPSSNNAWSFEAYIVKEADEIAQIHHDLEDAIKNNIITQREIIDIIDDCFSKIDYEYLECPDKDLPQSIFIPKLSKFIVGMLNELITKNSKEKLEEFGDLYNIKNHDDFIKKYPDIDEKYVKNVITYGSDVAKKFQSEIAKRVISNHDIQCSDEKGKYVIRKLFQALCDTPTQLPNHVVKNFMMEAYKIDDKGIISSCFKGIIPLENIIIERGDGFIRLTFKEFCDKHIHTDEKYKVALMRCICNYIASMTDTYAIELYRKLYI